MSPTLSLAMTQAGMILGTAACMSPEQARGQAVDKRADIWAFGVILFELLAGKMVFGGGATVTDTLAAVVLKEPDYSVLPADAPPRVRRLMERGLRKDPKQRLRDIGPNRFSRPVHESETRERTSSRARPSPAKCREHLRPLPW
jgi:serine/threonine protein kinase